MRRRLGALAVMAIASIAPTAAHAEPTIREKTVDKFGRKQVQKYAHFHRTWTHRSGRSVVGRQIVKHGMPKKGRDRVASRGEWRRTMAVFDRWENPPPPAQPAWSGSSPVESVESYGGPYAIPADIVACESGGDYNAVNPSSGAYGAYQVMPFHWESGICSDLGRDPAGQDACAKRIWDTSGPGAWTCSG